MSQLEGKKIAILATDGFEEAELFKPREALLKAGAEVQIVSLKSGKIKSWSDGDWSKSIAVDLTLADADAEEFDGLMLPGGVINADKLRLESKAVEFVKDFVSSGKPVAAICHAPWILIEAGGVKGRHLTSWASLQTDLQNAGATWSDEECVTDQGLVTSRKPDDIPVFNKKMIEEFAEGLHKPESKNVDLSAEMRH